MHVEGAVYRLVDNFFICKCVLVFAETAVVASRGCVFDSVLIACTTPAPRPSLPPPPPPSCLQDLTFDFHNNGIYLTKLPASEKGQKSKTSEKRRNTEKSKKNASGALATTGAGAGVDDGDGAEFVHPHDRNGKLLSKRFTTRRVRFGWSFRSVNRPIFGRSVIRSVRYLVCRSAGELVGRSIGRLVSQSASLSVGDWIGPVFDWSVTQSIGRLVGPLFGRSTDRLVGQLIGWSDDRSVGQLIGREVLMRVRDGTFI